MLGHGGMGVVFAARHLALDERVAIKVLAPAAAHDHEALARLQREARILARVRNEHVVRVIDLGQLEDGAPFMVMEHLTGRDLGNLLEQQGRLRVDVAVSYVLQALVALAAAHANGVVHRDLKPDNLFCTQSSDGAWLIKVLDFGISRLERPSQAGPSTSMTGPSAVMGTPLYMSPEQLRDPSSVDARSDIWSIGVVLFELVTGVAPFSGSSLGEIAIKIAMEPPPALAALDASLPAGLEAVLMTCLCKEREQRFANVAQLARALQPFGPLGCERLVERVERLAAESPIQIASDDKSGLPDVAPLSVAPRKPTPADPAPSSPPASALPVSSPPASSPPAPAPAALRSAAARRTQLLLALSVLLTLGVAWRLIAPHDRPTTLVGTPAAAGSLEQRRPSEVVADAPPITVTAVEPEVRQLVTDPPAQTAHSSDLAKSSPIPASSRALPAAKDLCSPPYTIDLQGRKKFRHECFTERTIR